MREEVDNGNTTANGEVCFRVGCLPSVKVVTYSATVCTVQ